MKDLSNAVKTKYLKNCTDEAGNLNTFQVRGGKASEKPWLFHELAMMIHTTQTQQLTKIDR